MSTQQSVSLASLVRHSLTGPGGWHCSCCAPQSGTRGGERVKTFLYRQAKKREAAGWVREQIKESNMEIFSALLEQREREDAEDAARAEEFDEYERTSTAKRIADLRNNFLRSDMGPVWETTPSCPDAWFYERTKEYGRDYGGDPSFSTLCLGKVHIDRGTFEWVVSVYTATEDDFLIRLPFMEHSLEQAQAMLAMLVRLEGTDNI